MSKMKELKFMVDLDWKIRFQGFDRIFLQTSYLKQFIVFLETETGKQWLVKENGQLYKKWQEE